MDAVINDVVTGLNGVGQAFWNYAAGIFVQVSVLIVFLLAADFLLRKRVRAVFRYCVWMLVFVKLVLPTSFALPTGIGYWAGDFLPVEYSADENAAAVEETKPLMMAQGQAEPARQEAVVIEPPAYETFPVVAGEAAPIEPVTSTATTDAGPVEIELEAISWQGLVFLGWLVGMLVLSVLLVQRAFFVKGLLAQAREADEKLRDLLHRCRVDVGVRVEVGLRVSDTMSSPAVCGLIWPTILLPRYLVEQLSEEKLRAVLLHECAHIKRWDLWVNLVQTVLQIVYFYNPFVWLANACVRRVREQAVDEMVLVALGRASESYGDVLIDIGEMAFWRPNFSLRLIGVVESKKALAARIKHIAGRPIPKSAKLGIVGLIAVTLIGAVLLPMARAEKADLGRDGAWRENSESTVSAEMLDAITQPTPHPAPALWIYEANGKLARLAAAIAEEDWKAVRSWGRTLPSYFRRFKYAVTVDDWRARLESQGEIDEKKDRRIRRYEKIRDILAACVSGEQGIEELRRLASELEELSGELHDAAAGDKLYLVPPIHEELDRKWKDFRATLRLGSIDTLGLVACWKFDESAGSTAYDLAGNNDGTIHGAQRFNGGLRFDGSDDYISIPHFHLAEFSFSVWLQPLDLSDNRRIFLLDDGDRFYAIQLNNRGGIGFGASTAAGETDYDVGVNEYDWRLAEDRWTHIVVTYDGSTVNIYKDGELTESGMGEFIKSVRGTAYLGGTDKYRGQFWHGMLDEVAIFNRPLSDEEVRRVYDMNPRVNTEVAKTVGGWSEPVRLAPAINTEYDENYPYLSADGRSLYFNSNRPGGFGGADIYVARKVDGVWQRPENLGPVVNSVGKEAGAMLSYDGKYLFFWSDRMAGPSTMLFVSKLVEGRFQTPEPLPYFINSALHTDEPFLTGDGKMLYFQTFGRQGNIKIRDLWCSRFSDGEFERPVNLGPVVNRFGRQKSPSLTADGRYLYYIYETADKSTGIVVSEKGRQNFMNPVEIEFPSLAELRASEPVPEVSTKHYRGTGPVTDEAHDTRDIIRQQDRDRPVAASEIESRATESDPGYPRGYIDSAKISWSGKELYFSMKDGNYDIWYAGQAPVEAIGRLDSGLVGYWKFDEGSGNTAYDSAGNNNGTIHGAKWTKGKVGGALSFDGKDNYVMIPDSDVFDFGKGNFSISTWFKTVSMSDQFIIGFRGSTKCIEMYVNSASYVGSYIDTGSETIRLPFINTKYNDGKWHHAAITLDNGVGNGYRLFLDGIMVGALTCSADFSDWSHIAIGGNPKGTWNKHFFNGQIDEIAIYNQALSAEKVQQLYQSQAAIYQEPSASSGLIAHWKFDEGGGTAAHDSAGGHRGIVRGAAWTAGKIGTGLGFDGIDDVVATAMNVDQSSSSRGATFCAWVYATSISEGRHHVISSDNRGYDWSLLREADIWYVFTGEGSRSAGFGVDLFKWQHVTAVFVPGTGVKFYKNGTEYTIPHIDYDDSDNNIAIGGSPARREEFFAGVIDEVKIFDHPLTAREVEQVYFSAEEIKRPSRGISRGPERRTSSGWVDILESIDVERDAKGGDWRCEDGTLIGFAQSTLQTSHELPAEYDVLWEFESNSTAINLLLASPLGKRFEWMMKGWSHRLCGVREVDCKPVNANETTTAFPLESGVRYVAQIKVRKDRFVALINGEEILYYKTDWSNVEVCKPWHPFELQGRRLGLWLNKHWTKTYRLKVRPHHGDRGVADNLIVPGIRVGNYAIGISKDDVLKSLGKPNVIFHRAEKYTLDNLPKEYFMVYDDIAFGVVDDSVEGVSALSPLYKFANGLGIGDSEQRIKQAFGDNYHFKETEGKDFLTYRDEGIQFEIHKDNRTVMEISVFRKTRQRPAGRRWVAPRKPKRVEPGSVGNWGSDEGDGPGARGSVGVSVDAEQQQRVRELVYVLRNYTLGFRARQEN